MKSKCVCHLSLCIACLCTLLFSACTAYTGRVMQDINLPQKEYPFKFYVRSIHWHKTDWGDSREKFNWDIINNNGKLELAGTFSSLQHEWFEFKYRKWWEDVLSNLQGTYGSLFTGTPKNAMPVDFIVEGGAHETGVLRSWGLLVPSLASLGIVPISNYSKEKWSITAKVDSFTNTQSTEVEIEIGGTAGIEVALKAV